MLSSVPVSVEPAANSGTPAKSKRLFSVTEVPFLVTVFIGLLCWSVTYFSDAIKKSPTVYYTKIDSSHTGADGICFLYNLDSATPIASRHSNQDWIGYEVTNLTRDQVFKDISFYIRATKGSLENPTAVPIAPAKISDRSPVSPQLQGTTIARYRLPEFHPGWTFQLRAHLAGGTPEDTQIIFDYSDRGDLGQALKVEIAPVRFVKSSLETYVAEHDFEIIESIFVISLIGIGWYAVFGVKNQ